MQGQREKEREREIKTRNKNERTQGIRYTRIKLYQKMSIDDYEKEGVRSPDRGSERNKTKIGLQRTLIYTYYSPREKKYPFYNNGAAI